MVGRKGEGEGREERQEFVEERRKDLVREAVKGSEASVAGGRVHGEDAAVGGEGEDKG